MLLCRLPPLHTGALRQEDTGHLCSSLECRAPRDHHRTPVKYTFTDPFSYKQTLSVSEYLTLVAMGVRLGRVAISFFSFCRSLVFPGCTAFRSLSAFSLIPSDFFRESMVVLALLTASVDVSYDF